MMVKLTLLIVICIPLVLSSPLALSLSKVAKAIVSGDIPKAQSCVMDIVGDPAARNEDDVNEMFHFVEYEMSHSIRDLIRSDPAIAMKNKQNIYLLMSMMLADVCRHDFCQLDIALRREHLNAYRKVLVKIQRIAVAVKRDGSGMNAPTGIAVDSMLFKWAGRHIAWIQLRRCELDFCEDRAKVKMSRLVETTKADSVMGPREKQQWKGDIETDAPLEDEPPKLMTINSSSSDDEELVVLRPGAFQDEQ